MTDLNILHFEQLKSEIQAQYLKDHHPSHDEISKWKGIDIIYFQEDLRKKAKGNISEKSFYTYFKTSPVTKLPRIDMLNLLSVYAGYNSWFEFKKNHLFANEIISEAEELSETDENELEKELSELPETAEKFQSKQEKAFLTENKTILTEEKAVLQNSITDNQRNNDLSANSIPTEKIDKKERRTFTKEYILFAITGILAAIVGLLFFKDSIFSKEFTYSFIDADRNSRINAELEVKILKENESPILFKVMPNEPFIYTTKSKKLVMEVSSPYYKTDSIVRNLETAPQKENIELKPNDYAIMLFYYSKSITDLKKKRESLNYLISNDALIYQVYDSTEYGVETMDKQRYISFVTLPTTSLENLEVIETKTDSHGKINMVKFRIKKENESNL